MAARNEVGASALSDAITARVLSTNSPPVIFDPPSELHMLSGDQKFVFAKAVGLGALIDAHLQDGTVSPVISPDQFQIPAQPGEFYFVARNT